MRSDILILISALVILTFLAVIRCYSFYQSSKLKINSTEGVLWSYPFESRGYQNLQINGVYIKTNYFPRYELGDYLVVSTRYSVNPFVLYNPKIHKIETKSIHILKIIAKFRNALVSITKAHMTEPYAGLLLGMTIGYKEDFPPDFLDMLKKTGTMHIVVVSGYNISVVMASVSTIFSIFGRRGSYFLSIIFTLLFLCIVGFEPSVVRATIMGLIALIGLYYGYARFSIYVLYLTLIFMLYINPSYLLDVGFQLSSIATFSILLCSMLNEGGSNSILSAFTTVFVNVAIIPIVSYYFGTVSIIGILCNVFILWIIPFITIGGFLFFIFPVFLLKTWLIILIDFYLVVSEFLVSFDFAHINYKFSIPIIFIYYTLLLLVYLIIFRWSRYLNE